jgi:hypothetical protein
MPRGKCTFKTMDSVDSEAQMRISPLVNAENLDVPQVMDMNPNASIPPSLQELADTTVIKELSDDLEVKCMSSSSDIHGGLFVPTQIGSDPIETKGKLSSFLGLAKKPAKRMAHAKKPTAKSASQLKTEAQHMGYNYDRNKIANEIARSGSTRVKGWESYNEEIATKGFEVEEKGWGKRALIGAGLLTAAGTGYGLYRNQMMKDPEYKKRVKSDDRFVKNIPPDYGKSKFSKETDEYNSLEGKPQSAYDAYKRKYPHLYNKDYDGDIVAKELSDDIEVKGMPGMRSANFAQTMKKRNMFKPPSMAKMGKPTQPVRGGLMQPNQSMKPKASNVTPPEKPSNAPASKGWESYNEEIATKGFEIEEKGVIGRAVRAGARKANKVGRKTGRRPGWNEMQKVKKATRTAQDEIGDALIGRTRGFKLNGFEDIQTKAAVMPAIKKYVAPAGGALVASIIGGDIANRIQDKRGKQTPQSMGRRYKNRK